MDGWTQQSQALRDALERGVVPLEHRETYDEGWVGRWVNSARLRPALHDALVAAGAGEATHAGSRWMTHLRREGYWADEVVGTEPCTPYIAQGGFYVDRAPVVRSRLTERGVELARRLAVVMAAHGEGGSLGPVVTVAPAPPEDEWPEGSALARWRDLERAVRELADVVVAEARPHVGRLLAGLTRLRGRP